MNKAFVKIAEAAANALKPDGVQKIRASELLEMLTATEEVTIIDVRNRPDYERGHIRGSISMPLEEVELRHRELDSGKPVIVY